MIRNSKRLHRAHKQQFRLKNKHITQRSMGIVAGCAGLLMLYVWQHIQSVRLGYEVQALQSQISEQANENNIIQVRINQLASLDRLENLAKTRLGLELPKKEDIVMVSLEHYQFHTQTAHARLRQTHADTQ